MNEQIKKFRDLLFTDEEFRQELKAAGEAYTGEQDEKSVFENVLVPLAEKHGISATYEEFKAYIDQLNEAGSDISDQELVQISGGGKGYGMVGCYVVGAGLGGAGGSGKGGACFFVGAGWQGASCSGSGFTDDIDIGSLING